MSKTWFKATVNDNPHVIEPGYPSPVLDAGTVIEVTKLDEYHYVTRCGRTISSANIDLGESWIEFNEGSQIESVGYIADQFFPQHLVI